MHRVHRTVQDLLEGLNDIQVNILRLFGAEVCHLYQISPGEGCSMSATYAPYSSLLLGPFAELPVHHIIGLSESLTGCAVSIVVTPSCDLRVDFPYEFA